MNNLGSSGRKFLELLLGIVIFGALIAGAVVAVVFVVLPSLSGEGQGASTINNPTSTKTGSTPGLVVGSPPPPPTLAPACTLPNSAGAQTVGTGLNSPFGLNIHAASRYGRRGQLQIPLDAARGTCIGWNREDIRWEAVQRNSGLSFDYSLIDEAVTKSLARGINVVGVLLYKGDNSVPDPDTWNKFVSTTVSYFKGKIDYWQIWNEPENKVFFAGADPANYARLLKASYSTIKSVNPQAKVLTAGVNGFAVPWLQQMLDAGGAGQYDILAVHPYVSFSASPEAKYWADNQLAYFMAFNRRNGNKPVWATEFGWPTANNPAAVSESAQANYLARLYVTGLANGLSKLFVYQFRDQGANSDDNYGLVRADWTTPKPSYAVYKNLVERLSGAVYKEKIDLFEKNGQIVENFENSPAWKPYNAGAASANLALSAEQVHSGSTALKVDYSLQGEGYIEVGQAAVPLKGQPTKIGFWIFGDDTGALFRILVTGSDGQLFVYEPGKVGGKVWHKLEAFVPGEYVNKGQTGGDGVLRYPVSFKSIQLLRQPDPLEATWNSTLYLDDFYAAEGPNVQLYRFEKNNRTLDVIWSDGGGGPLSLTTGSSADEIKAYDRNGNKAAFSLSNNMLNFMTGEDMFFFEHN